MYNFHGATMTVKGSLLPTNLYRNAIFDRKLCVKIGPNMAVFWQKHV